MTLTYFTARSTLVTYAFLWEKVKTVDFSETIAACDLKVGRCRQLIEIMKVLKVKVISLPYIFQVLYVLCFTNVKISCERLQDQWFSGFHIGFTSFGGISLQFVN